MQSGWKRVGIVQALYRYPVKSMHGEEITESKLGWHGFEGDRRYAFVRSHNKTGFPWLTARDLPELLLYRPSFSNPDDIRQATVMVQTPQGTHLSVDSPALLSELSQLYGQDIHLMQLWGGIFDAADISVLTLTTLGSLNELTERELDVRRFRPNIVIDTPAQGKFPEDKWVSSTLAFGDGATPARIRTQRKDLRCMIINLDPETATQDPKILKEVVAQRKNHAGVYGATHWPGVIKVGDPVYLCT